MDSKAFLTILQTQYLRSAVKFGLPVAGYEWEFRSDRSCFIAQTLVGSRRVSESWGALKGEFRWICDIRGTFHPHIKMNVESNLPRQLLTVMFQAHKELIETRCNGSVDEKLCARTCVLVWEMFPMYPRKNSS